MLLLQAVFDDVFEEVALALAKRVVCGNPVVPQLECYVCTQLVEGQALEPARQRATEVY